MNNIIVTIILLLCIGCSDNKAKVISYGIVETTIAEKEDSPHTVTGKINIIDTWNLVKATTQIPGKLGTTFGLSYTVSVPVNKKEIIIEEVIIFPSAGITNPITGKHFKTDTEFIKILPNENRYACYSFEYPWEIKTGTWIFQVKQDGVILLEQKFDIQ